ncbi:ribonuclease-like [Pelodiscus sinensis]|uniref:ribonuclease-like n=1 Tax=Pelodiscus sinensis TaxID=13735 RepID=UPI003F6BFD24
MALRGSCPTLLLALALLGAWLALASGQRPKGTYDMFLRRHWDNPKTPVNSSIVKPKFSVVIFPLPSPYCDLQTRARGIQGSNIFIHERLAVISSLCKKGGRPLPRGRRISKRPLSLTLCKTFPMGQGYTEKSASRRIVVVCRNKRPVRLLRVVRPSSWA